MVKNVAKEKYAFNWKSIELKRDVRQIFTILCVTYRIVSNKRPGGVAIFQKGDVYKRQVFNAKMQCLSLFTMTRRREI